MTKTFDGISSLTKVPLPKVDNISPTIINVTNQQNGISSFDLLKSDSVSNFNEKEVSKTIDVSKQSTKQYSQIPSFIIQTARPIPKLNIPPLEVQQNENISTSQLSKSFIVNKETKSINTQSDSLKTINEFLQPEKKEIRFQCSQLQLNHLNSLKTKDKKKPDWERLKQVSKTNEACQQAVFIGLLNMFGYEIGIERVYKISKKTFPLLTIKFVHRCTPDGNQDMEIMNSATRLSEEMLKSSTVEDKKKRRQRKRNMDASICNSLMDYLEQEGVKFEIKGTRSAQYTMVMKKVKDIDLVLFNKQRKINQKDIVNIGKYINNHLVKMMGGLKRRAISSEQFIRIEPNEPDVTNIFLNHFNGLLKEFDESTKCIDIDYDSSQNFLTWSALPQPFRYNKLKYPNEYYSFIKPDIIDFICHSFS
ncbi:hypothetical protein EHI8A_065810 [Entamoeba histolytica HM-1:IMSS-B]|uniref:Uncharacterized protein n=5 Tax=Entamoeba histolytica TaxID=5759 RepID=C4M4U9_ENTH1|nr:hypothetical protein EHI_193450 [Entamoeba histolytica HM-1:IMSS]EMH76593.1 hypothetical protein EHI8A_065810 [Entamoeba histolytica HM-1:IMSS-B]EMS16132.1 hypothetical protein KM1_041600 [Entamoeba histolytica HM-3:IMSS]ENY62344.1 hypothetical protein EHI7A_062610 [Entamoeba histolytica HM-1:IMSS-A]GAT96406.1 hypothetical protein CL6EHI_193450 [Entamoeba histolytica]EAL46671.1 hypothetical protein EHI_193450 [Entamoeba histolytica HM-1:IMSS]|eukprot:XP_652059.1 hypothetical protein EHI_193450 [Entamoeba histolytica HM-1:IMSS]